VAYRVLKLLLLPLHGKPADTFSMIMKKLVVRAALASLVIKHSS